MPDRLSLHAPVLVNTIGHCAGAIIFGTLLYLFILDWRRDPRKRSPLPCVAAALALLWNAGSLIGLATPVRGAAVADAIVAASFSVLSLLPAVLLHISLGSRRSSLWIAGYAVSGGAVALHISDLLTTAPRFHYAGILLITIGFGALTSVSLIREAASGSKDGAGARLAAAMVLFLFAVSFAHFESAHPATAWSGEAALHHAGIPLALFVLLQDYRFLLLDVFIRLLVNTVLAVAAVAGAVYVAIISVRNGWPRDPFLTALLFVAACLLLTFYGFIRTLAQRWLTRVVFLRTSVNAAIAMLREAGLTATNETDYLPKACKSIADFLSATLFELTGGTHPGLTHDVVVSVFEVPALSGWNGLPSWVHAIAPLRFAGGDARLLLLGARAGGRRYLSEDVRALERLSSIVCEQVERIRLSDMQNLVSQAELRALQAQINPHFLFNSLNTLYGAIQRKNAPARRLVTNLASLFRYALGSERSFIGLAEELRIVRAYLEIEQLRLGPRLTTSFEIDEAALPAEIPVFSIQPLVENAIRHGVAIRRGSGFVKVAIRRREQEIRIAISNSGPFRQPAPDNGSGIGLMNVRKRLSLCYGAESQLNIESGEDHTEVSFTIPLARAAKAMAQSIR
jgi:hypothetical protein